ncbi:MAG: sigma-70 family RNA polymerase sigma factor [Humibacillus sp.]|nr:sigma-70 family RNA polymerase sigma factor [Humibacillus sp.]MDN5776648.1 sigma-70 family RNA polymerase sigma factor [Humibacillus sp.]
MLDQPDDVPRPEAVTPSERALRESTLVVRAQDGDAGAFERLVHSYEKELLRLGYRMLSDLGEAQDAVQDSLVLSWRQLPTLEDPRAFQAWVYQLMTRRCLNLLRSRRRRRTSLTGEGDLDQEPAQRAEGDHLDPPSAAAQSSALGAGLDVALTTLSAELRACWVLKELHHLSYPEIAYAIGVPVATVRGRIARARLHLAKEMSEWR